MSELCNKTTLVQQKKLPNVPKHCNANDQTVIIHKTVHNLFFLCASNSLLLYVQYDYMPSIITIV